MKTFDTYEKIIGRDCVKRPIIVQAVQINEQFRVKSLEGDYAQGQPGDYLMTGIQGEHYICARGVFEATYDFIDNWDSNIMKELIKEYIEMLDKVSKKEEALAAAMIELNPDNYIIGMVPDVYVAFMEKLLLAHIGADRMDWLMWWLYDINQMSSTITLDNVEYQINNFDDLWEYCLK